MLQVCIRRFLSIVVHITSIVLMLVSGVSCDSATEATGSGNSGALAGGTNASESEELKQVPVAETEEDQQKILKRFIDEMIAVQPGTEGSRPNSSLVPMRIRRMELETHCLKSRW